jgi:NAD(P)-dependent dehydrogenase (short-subunit alcohol dehydrogenase family)
MAEVLAGRAALVTGASSGLGRRMATCLARGGARVAVAARRVDRLEALAREIADLGGHAVPIALDVTDADSVAQCVAAAADALGTLDILVNNAGIAEAGWIVDTDVVAFDRVMDTNLKGAWLIATEFGRRVIEHGQGGTIVNIASIAGVRAQRQLSVYGMSKAALIQMTRSMALEWARHRIRVNALAPGYIATEMNEAFFESDDGRRALNGFPNRRVGHVADIDGPLMLLVSDAGAFITGSVITLDDGQSL